jgi:hypothetical protein
MMPAPAQRCAHVDLRRLPRAPDNLGFVGLASRVLVALRVGQASQILREGFAPGTSRANS